MSDLIERLREDARKRAREHGSALPDNFIEWEAADAIADLQQQLALARQRKEHARREVNRAMDKMMEDGK